MSAKSGAPRRTILYGRTSNDVSDGKSVDDQLSVLRKWARDTGRTVVAELRDDGVSASRFTGVGKRKKQRPDWQRAMELIADDAADELAVWEISRSTRDRPVWAALIAACIEHEVDIAVDGKVHDPSDPDDGFMLDLSFSMGVREAALISKRTRRAVASRAAAGRPNGALTYGYRRVIDPETGQVVGRDLHPEHAPVVREIIDRLLARESARSIAMDLNRRGIPAPAGGRWLGGNLSILARRAAYAGLRVYRGKVLPGVKATWPAIITEAEHHKLLEMYADPARDKWRNSTAAKHLGTGIFRCGREECGGPMRVIYQSAGRLPAYTCRVCTRVSRRQDHVDEMVNDVMIAWLSRPDSLAAIADRSDVRAQEAADQAARLKAKLAEARQAWEDDRLSLEAYADMEARMLPKIRAAEQRARPSSAPAALLEMAGSGERTREAWFALPIIARRACVAWSLEVVVLPVGSHSLHFDRNGVRITPRQVGLRLAPDGRTPRRS